MERPSKKEIKAALEKMKGPSLESDPKPYLVPAIEAKKPNKNRIRKKGV